MTTATQDAPSLQQWVTANKAEEGMIYGPASERQAATFAAVALATGAKACDVISTHRSKSVLLPVVRFTMANGATVIVRDNFHNYRATVIADSAVAIDGVSCSEGVGEPIHRVYCEGFPEDMRLGAYGDERGLSRSRFTVAPSTLADLTALVIAAGKTVSP